MLFIIINISIISSGPQLQQMLLQSSSSSSVAVQVSTRLPSNIAPQLCVHAVAQGKEERRDVRGSMGGRRSKGRCGRRERESGRVGGKAVAGENLLGEGLRIEGGYMRKEKWGEGALRIDQEDIGVMSTHTGNHGICSNKYLGEVGELSYSIDEYRGEREGVHVYTEAHQHHPVGPNYPGVELSDGGGTSRRQPSYISRQVITDLD